MGGAGASPAQGMGRNTLDPDGTQWAYVLDPKHGGSLEMLLWTVLQRDGYARARRGHGSVGIASKRICRTPPMLPFPVGISSASMGSPPTGMCAVQVSPEGSRVGSISRRS